LRPGKIGCCSKVVDIQRVKQSRINFIIKIFKINTSSGPKKSCIRFFLHSKISNSGKWHLSLYINRENEAEKFSQVWRALKKSKKSEK
jgi:hypothetical protein